MDDVYIPAAIRIRGEHGGEFRVVAQVGLKVVKPEGIMRLKLPQTEAVAS